MAANPEISAVSPVFGCAPCLEQLVRELELSLTSTGRPFEVILVDDGSSDDAWTVISQMAEGRPWLRGLRLSRNFGQHAAIIRGISAARGEWIAVLDCDLQDPPAAIPSLYDHALSGPYDTVFAVRSNRQDPALKRASSWGFYRFVGWLTGVRLDERIANFGVYHRRVIQAVLDMEDHGHAFPLMVRWVGFRQSALPVAHGRRAAGRSSYSLSKLLRLATQVVLGYSDRPLRLVTGAGFACGLVSFLFAGLAVYKYLQGDIQVAGYTSVIASVWLIGGLMLACIGVVGLYVGQVFTDVQGRPSSIVAETLGGLEDGPR